ncbi:MAG: hypothetical protein AAF989_12200 [Planctomycetota bacterium]
MLLIVGGSSDPNTMRVVHQADARNVEHVFWDTDQPESRRLAWDFQSPVLDLDDCSLQPSAVFLRYNVFDGDPVQNQNTFEVIQAYALAWPQIRLLNREICTDSNNKSRNLQLAVKAGFEIPDSLVLADLTPLSTMPDPQSRIIKPLNGGAHTKCVSEVAGNPELLADLGPHFVQEKLPGENLRIFCIDSQLSCFHLVTGELDYRDDAAVEVVQIEVPEELVAPTMRLARRVGFDYCALDFRCRQNFDAPVFLEVNSFPMFVRFDDAGQGCLSDAMLRFFAATKSN